MRSGGALFLSAFLTAAPAAAEDSICADRPGKATPSCTVAPGKTQVELGFVDWSHDRSAGVRSDSLAIGDTAVKFGLSDRLHIEFDLTPFVQLREGNGRVSGIGDSGIALKYRVTADDAPVQLALYPFVKLPTARHSIGNSKVEGGFALLADSTFAGTSVGWNVDPEVHIVGDGNGGGYHFAIAEAAGIGVPLSRGFTLSGELWGAWDFDPAGTVRQYSLDAAAALLLSKDVQVDGGVNLGLNRNTPDVELSSGIALRF